MKEKHEREVQSVHNIYKRHEQMRKQITQLGRVTPIHFLFQVGKI